MRLMAGKIQNDLVMQTARAEHEPGWVDTCTTFTLMKAKSVEEKQKSEPT
jgi:hypothetical protein